MINVNPYSWEDSFPTVFGHTSISFLKHCPGFEDAKLGDMRSALTVVNMCVKSKRIAELKKKYPNAVLLPVITNNKPPEAFAKKIGMTTHTGVYKLEAQKRKTL